MIVFYIIIPEYICTPQAFGTAAASLGLGRDETIVVSPHGSIPIHPIFTAQLYAAQSVS